MTQAAASTAGSRPPRRVVHLFDGPYVTCGGERLTVPQGGRRLVAFLALRRGPVERAYAAGALWPSGDDGRAQGNLRSSLWRLRRAGIDVVVADKWSLTLAEDVVVDVAILSEWANRLLHGEPARGDLSIDQLPDDALNLLPGWYDDWAIIERERMRQRMMHAMEALSRHLTGLGRYADAIEVALAVVAAEPMRESAERVLLEALLAQGNRAEAGRAYADFRELLVRELGVEPSRQLAALLRSTPGARAPMATTS